MALDEGIEVTIKNSKGQFYFRRPALAFELEHQTFAQITPSYTRWIELLNHAQHLFQVGHFGEHALREGKVVHDIFEGTAKNTIVVNGAYQIHRQGQVLIFEPIKV